MTQQQPESSTSNGGNKPVDEVRIGPVRAAIWANTNAEGETRHNVTVSKSYRDSEGNPKDTRSFGVSDLLPLAKAADVAHTKVMRLIAEQRGRSL